MTTRPTITAPAALAGLGAYDPFAQWQLARSLFERPDYLGAVEVLNRLIDDHDDEVDGSHGLGAARELLARCYFHSAQLGRAADVARDELARDPSNAFMAVLLSRSLERASVHDEAASARRLAAALGAEVGRR